MDGALQLWFRWVMVWAVLGSVMEPCCCRLCSVRFLHCLEPQTLSRQSTFSYSCRCASALMTPSQMCQLPLHLLGGGGGVSGSSCGCSDVLHSCSMLHPPTQTNAHQHQPTSTSTYQDPPKSTNIYRHLSMKVLGHPGHQGGCS